MLPKSTFLTSRSVRAFLVMQTVAIANYAVEIGMPDKVVALGFIAVMFIIAGNKLEDLARAIAAVLVEKYKEHEDRIKEEAMKVADDVVTAIVEDITKRLPSELRPPE
jgi:tetrahydromethanopterin S-methyltransferase subunit C